MISNRELFTRIMSYDSFDRMPVVHWDQWDETRERWIREGLPPEADPHGFLDAPFLWETLIDPQSWLSVGKPRDVITIGLFPPFEEEVLEKSGDFTVVRNRDGTMTRRFANRTSMPQYLGCTFKTAADWDQYKRRLQPDPARISPSAPQALEELSRSGRPLCFPLGYGDVSRFARDLLDCGVNVLFPVEVGKFRGDAVALRKTYGRELRCVGNFDKMALERGERAIASEIERLHPLMEQGGYVIMPDHHITPGVPLAAYRRYLDQVRRLRF